MSPALAGGFLTTEPSGKPKVGTIYLRDTVPGAQGKIQNVSSWKQAKPICHTNHPNPTERNSVHEINTMKTVE